jgi:hypothetical protein
MTTPVKVQQIHDRLVAKTMADAPRWDRVEITDISKDDFPFWKVEAVHHEGTLAEERLAVYHTGRRFAGARRSALIGKDREYKRLADLWTHELRNWI